MEDNKNTIIVGITGASGAVYGKRIVEVLVANGYCVELIFSEVGRKVFEFETEVSAAEFVASLPKELVSLYDEEDFFAPPSSGTHPALGMVIAPCSAGTLGHIASGATSNLIHRAADVSLKEGRKLVLLFREAPINKIHAENILRVIEAGATVVPASPAFYSKPKTLKEAVDFVVEKTLRALLGKEFGLVKSWSRE